jgi:hypothetical protein
MDANPPETADLLHLAPLAAGEREGARYSCSAFASISATSAGEGVVSFGRLRSGRATPSKGLNAIMSRCIA